MKILNGIVNNMMTGFSMEHAGDYMSYAEKKDCLKEAKNPATPVAKSESAPTYSDDTLMDMDGIVFNRG